MKGFGFIEPKDDGPDLFVHKSNVEGKIRDGDKVEFEVGETDKGPNATNVRNIGDSIDVEKGPMKSGKKLCTSCEKSKQANAWSQGTFHDGGVTICRRCAEKSNKTKKSAVDYNLMTVADLKETLRERGLLLGGLKADLCSRLESDDKSKKKPEKKPKKKKVISSRVEEEGIVPFNYLSENLKKNKDSLLERLENGDSLLVYCLKRQVGIPFSPNVLLNDLRTSFPDCSVEPLGWPETINKITGMSTHPLMKEMIHSAVTVIPKGSDSLECMKVDELKEHLRARGLPVSGRKSELVARLGTQQQDSSPIKEAFISVLAKAVHERFLNKGASQKSWTILGDETGDFSDYKQGKQYEQDPQYKNSVSSSMLWVVIPPKSHTQVPLMHPYYHATEERFEEDTRAAISTLANNENIMCFVFSYDSGLLSDNLRGMAKMEHLAMWQFTLPLVLEKVSQLVTEGDQIDIFLERIDPLVPGIKSAALVQEFLGGLSGRSGWGNMVVRDSPVLAKNPLEHGWLGYPDVLGHILWGMTDRYGEKTRGDISRLQEHWTKVPFRQDSLNGCILQALKDTARPLVFLKSLAAISYEDMRDYIEPFFSSAISESVSSLDDGEWEELLEHMDISAKNKRGQNATSVIHGHLDINETLETMSISSVKMDFLLAMLGTSNHIGAITQANMCISLINDMLEDGFRLKPDRRKKFENLSGGSNDNVFDFSHIHAIWVGSLPEDPNEISNETEHYLGAQALSRALRAEDLDWDEANHIENFLRTITTNQKDLLRRWIYNAELQLGGDDNDGALESLEMHLPALVSTDAEALRNDPYYCATLLKCCALSARDASTFSQYSKQVPSLLDDRHPSQRIAYWCARWGCEIGLSNDPIVKACSEHLVKLTEVPFFKKDAPGIILACELLDLKSRSMVDFDAEGFLDEVLKNSAETTQDWVKQHQPSVNDWLAPLNFNYL